MLLLQSVDLSHIETSVSVPSCFSADIRHALLPLTVTLLLQMDQPPTVRLDCEVGVRNVHSEHAATHLNSPPESSGETDLWWLWTTSSSRKLLR